MPTRVEQLKKFLTAVPVLGFPVTQGQIVLDTDASENGIGAVLSQAWELAIARHFY